ncbi:MAG: hypothetical protein QM708_13525 [Propioniciclava sp.]|uniref:hypothetical protein n=1 Tax=Propioniciclava sp. TaxID=2038686 RepID=UPI0039E63B3B
MPTQADRLGPGHLVFGQTGTLKEFGSQVTKVALEPDTEEGEVTTVLSGEEVRDDDTDSFKLTGEFFQDYTSGLTSLIVWCKTHNNQVIDFEFIPAAAGNLGVRGKCRIKPVKTGGDVKSRNTTEFSFPGVGDYTYFEPDGD